MVICRTPVLCLGKLRLLWYPGGGIHRIQAEMNDSAIQNFISLGFYKEQQNKKKSISTCVQIAFRMIGTLTWGIIDWRGWCCYQLTCCFLSYRIWLAVNKCNWMMTTEGKGQKSDSALWRMHWLLRLQGLKFWYLKTHSIFRGTSQKVKSYAS